MLTDPETGAPRCDHCGGEVDRPVGLDATEALCRRCDDRHHGYTEGLAQAAREQLEVAVLHAINDLGEAETRVEVDRLISTRRALYSEVR